VAQAAYGRTRDRAEHLYEDGYRLADEAASRGHHLHQEARTRGRHLRDEANRRGRELAIRADENRGTTLALVAATAFGLGWLFSRRR
jgi:hypothetical protein